MSGVLSVEPEIEPIEIIRRTKQWYEFDVTVPGMITTLALALITGVWIAILMR